MIDFREPQLQDKPRADKIFYNLDYLGCEYSFGNIYIWRKYYKSKLAFDDNFILLKATYGENSMYLFPAGTGNIKAIIELLMQDAEQNGHEFLLSGLTPNIIEQLEVLYPNKFEYTPVRDGFDYVYNAEDLLNLAGKKYHSKRNHIARFKELGEWSFEDISNENLAQCKKMSDEWCIMNECSEDNALKAEACAVREAFNNYNELGFTGGLLKLDGRIIAFSIGERLGRNNFVVHIEKAFFNINGAYTMINQQFAQHFYNGFTYVNREEDMGLAGLRKSKSSYYPSILLEKSIAKLKKV
jgi:hypothetical protein